MLADSMDATSNARLSHIADIAALKTKWRMPDARKAYTEESQRLDSPGFDSRGFEGAEAPPKNPDAKYEHSRYLLSERMVESVSEKISELMRFSFRRLEYNYHEDSGEYFVKVIDEETDEVIREIPPEKILNIYACLKEIAGILFDERR